jgi:ferrous iron transport protein B
VSAAPATAPQPTAARAKHPVVAIAGNPNSGKTTLFNRLTGLRQRVGNYPGVTIERKTGDATLPGGTHVELVDIPGTYSLVARSREEGIAFDVITGRHSAPPDLVLIVLDASNLERNLYFALQILELGRPAMIVLNMIDVADSLGLAIDASVLSQALGCARGARLGVQGHQHRHAHGHAGARAVQQQPPRAAHVARRR